MINQDISLKTLNTFQIDVKAKYLFEFDRIEELIQVIKSNQDDFINQKKLVLGSGSNVLFTQDFDGFVIKPNLKGITVVKETDTDVWIKSACSELWHDLVTFSVERNLHGIENMALIPGTVGAAPIQNIAAYGQNLVDTFDLLEAINLTTGKIQVFDKQACEFAYRDSIFKNQLKNQFLVISVTLKLSKILTLDTSYFQMHVSNDSIKTELAAIAKEPYSIKDVYQAVINIRTRKLPDPAKSPNIGSFFLNPLVSKEKLTELQSKISELQFYPPDQLTYKQLNDPEFVKDDYVKLPAGRLLDELGWRGKWIGNVGTHDKQALLIVTNGKAKGAEIINFANQMKQSVKNAYGIDLQSEVNII